MTEKRRVCAVLGSHKGTGDWAAMHSSVNRLLQYRALDSLQKRQSAVLGYSTALCRKGEGPRLDQAESAAKLGE